MFTQADLDYIAEAKRAYPSMPALEATLAFALAEAREANAKILPFQARTVGFRENRDSALVSDQTGR